MQYRTEIDHTEEGNRLSHFVTLANGKEVECDFSPHATMTAQDVETWVSLGCPERVGVAPLNSVTLAKLGNEYSKHLDALREESIEAQESDEAWLNRWARDERDL